MHANSQEFSGIESEWPLFFALLVIDGVFKKDDEQVDKYQEKLRKHLSYNEYGGKCIGSSNINLSLQGDHSGQKTLPLTEIWDVPLS